MKKNLTIPNLLSLLRILLVPFFLILYLNKNFYVEGFPLYAVLVFLLAFTLDVLDGLIARKTNTVTNLGKVLDPLADKILRLSVIFGFMLNGILPLYMFIILLVIDLFSIVIGAILYANKIVVKANIVGKITTIIMSLSLFSCFFNNIIKPYDLIAVMVSIILVFITLVQYFVKYYKIYKKIK